jgi:hypothetical protein
VRDFLVCSFDEVSRTNLPITKPTHSMQQSSYWEANSHSDSQLPRLLWNLKVHYRVDSPPLVPILIQTNLVHTFSSCFLKIRSDIIFSYMPRSSFEKVTKFKYFGTTLTNQNDTHDKIKSRWNSGNACYYSVQNLLSSRVISKNLKIKV